jgi:cytochrome P450
VTNIDTSAATTAGVSAVIPDFPMARAAGCPFDPPPDLRMLATQAPITRVRLWDGSTPWLLTRYAEQRALLANPRISADTTLPGYPHASAGSRERRNRARTFLNMDDPEHARLRRMVTAPFAIKRVEALRPAIQRIVDTLIDECWPGRNRSTWSGRSPCPCPHW